MGRVLKIVFYALLLALAFLWISTVYKSCQNKKIDSKDLLIEGEDEYDDTFDEETIDLSTEDDEFESDFDESEEKSYKELEEALDDVDDLTEPYVEPEKEKTPVVQQKPKSNPTPKRSTVTPASSSSYGGYLIVAGNYSIEANAETMRSKLKRMGYNKAEIVQFENSSFSTVVASRFTDYEKALNEAASLKSRGIDCYVHKKKD